MTDGVGGRLDESVVVFPLGVVGARVGGDFRPVPFFLGKQKFSMLQVDFCNSIVDLFE